MKNYIEEESEKFMKILTLAFIFDIIVAITVFYWYSPYNRFAENHEVNLQKYKVAVHYFNGDIDTIYVRSFHYPILNNSGALTVRDKEDHMFHTVCTNVRYYTYEEIPE